MDGQSVSSYVIRGKVAEGAQGTVYEAVHERMGRRVALKFLHREALLDPEDRRRFDHEARIAARLDHSSICPIYDYDEMDGRVFLAMPFLEGRNLRELLQDGPLPQATAVLIAIQVAEGLQEAHRQGIIHRDIKPSNIMVTGFEDGRPQAKILDFGLARSMELTVLTRTDNTVGTAAYMSPEQVHGWQLDGRTDIWSLGAVLYEMVAGRRAFPGDSPQAVAYAITHEEPEPVGSLRPEARPELRRIIGRALEREPKARYRDVAELLSDLRALREEITIRRGPLRDWLWMYRNRLAMVGGGVLALAIVVVGALAVLDRLPRWSLPLDHARQVTFDEGWEGEPALSPDGSRLAYTRFNGTDLDICWVGVTGSDPVPLVTGPSDDSDPVWLPDGSGLLFSSNRSGRTDIWKSDLSGRNVLQVIADARDPEIAADGRQLTFIRANESGHFRIFVADLDKPEASRQVSRDGTGVWSHFSPAFSPDDRWLCYTDYHDLWLLDLAAGTARALTTGGTWDANPAWAPDGRHVYFSSRRSGPLSLWRVAAAGGPPVRLTPGSGPESHPSLDAAGLQLAYATSKEATNVLLMDRGGAAVPVTEGWSQSQQPALAPDASFVVYTALRQGGTYRLWRRDLAEGRPVGSETQLTDQPGNASHPVVSRDGRWVAYYLIDERNGNRDVWTVPSRGGIPVQVTNDPAQDSCPAWAPDGRRLAFVSEREGRSAIHVVGIEDGRSVGEPLRVSPLNLPGDYPAWSPDGRNLVFIGTVDGSDDAFLVAAGGGSEARRLTRNANIHLLRWLTDSGEIWASANWEVGPPSLRRLDPATGASTPLAAPRPFPAETKFAWFSADADGRLVAMTQSRMSGDIWVIEAREGDRF